MWVQHPSFVFSVGELAAPTVLRTKTNQKQPLNIQFAGNAASSVLTFLSARGKGWGQTGMGDAVCTFGCHALPHPRGAGTDQKLSSMFLFSLASHLVGIGLPCSYHLREAFHTFLLLDSDLQGQPVSRGLRPRQAETGSYLAPPLSAPQLSGS